MSRSPVAADAESKDDYVEAIAELERLEAEGKSFSGRERHCAFLNTGDGTFANVSAVSGLDFADDGRAVAYVDWDRDGDLDLWFANRTGPQLRYLRNDTPSDHRFLSLRLRGTRSNRDAVGARVTLRLAGGGVAVRTVRAGHGFLGQSSKDLHFGLGSAGEIDALEVRWPGGEREPFAVPALDAHYLLVEGAGVPEADVRPGSAPDALEPAELPNAKPVSAGRTFLAGRPRLPSLTYRGFEGQEVEFAARGPALVNLWATWCLPCRAELREWAAELDDAGLHVLLLSVDGMDPERGTASPAEVRATLREFGVTFDAGMATAELLDKLQLLHDGLFERHLSLPVPTTFLVDETGRVAAVYRGRTDVRQIESDLRSLALPPVERRVLASPLRGRWRLSPQGPRSLDLAQSFQAAGHADDAIGYLRDALARDPGDAAVRARLVNLLTRAGRADEALEVSSAAARTEPRSAEAQANLAQTLAAGGRTDEAIEAYRAALALDSEHLRSLVNLGMLLHQQGDRAASAEHYRRALRIDPTIAEAHMNLGAVLWEMGEADVALQHLAEAARVRPRDVALRFALASALQSMERAEQAVVHLEQAVAAAPRHAGAHRRLARACASLQRWDKALEHWQRVIDLRPRDVEAHNGLGVAFRETGRAAAARAAFERALEIDPAHAGARANLDALGSNGG